MALAVCLLPVLVVRYVPLIDLPGHLGRLHILQHYAENPAFQQRYQLVHRPLPNMLIDLFSPLEAWLRMEDVGRLFVIVSIVLFALGCAAMSRTLYGLITPFAVLAVFSQYNSMFFFGYVQFQAGVGLFLITLALWMRWRGHFNAFRLAALAILSVATYLAHLGGYAFLGLSAAFLVVLDFSRKRRWDRSAVAGIVAMLGPVFLFAFAHGPYGNVATPEWAPVTLKAQHLLIHVMGFNGVVDASFAAVLLVAAVIVLSKGQIRFHPELGPLAAFFGVLFLVFPYFIGDGPDADTRVFVATFVLALLCCRIRLPQPAGRILFSIVFAALVLRIGYIGSVWIQQDGLIASNVEFFDQIPIGARVYGIVTLGPTKLTVGLNQAKLERPLIHALGWATIRRNILTPSVFTVEGQHPVFERTGQWAFSGGAVPDASGWNQILRNYDFIWYYGTDQDVLRQLHLYGKLVGTNGKGSLYRIGDAQSSANGG